MSRLSTKGEKETLKHSPDRNNKKRNTETNSFLM